MFYWLRACRDEEGYIDAPECFRTRAKLPWPFPKNHNVLTKAERRRRIFPEINCEYNNLRTKPACDTLLKRVGADMASMRRQAERNKARRRRMGR